MTHNIIKQSFFFQNFILMAIDLCSHYIIYFVLRFLDIELFCQLSCVCLKQTDSFVSFTTNIGLT